MTQKIRLQGSDSSGEGRNEIIKAYTQAGYTLMPCVAKLDLKTGKSQKVPKFKGWRNTNYNPHLDPADLPKMYGVVLQDDDCVFDVDPRRFANGINQLQELWAELNLESPINSFIVRSGGDDCGLHIYFKKAPEHLLRANLPPAIEIKSRGKFVVAAGSIHPDTGAPYTVIRNSPFEAANLPDVLMRYCLAVPKVISLSKEFNDDATQNQYITYLLNAPPAIEGEEGNNTTYKVACQGRDYGLSEEMVFGLMCDHYNRRCIPEWSVAELETIVRNAFEYAQNSQGAASAASDFCDVEIEEQSGNKETHISSVGENYKQVTRLWDLIDSKTNRPAATLGNAISYLDRLNPYPDALTKPIQLLENPLCGLIAYNLFANTIEFQKPAPWHKANGKFPQFWEEHDTLMLKYWLSQHSHFLANIPILEEAIKTVSHFYAFHPVIEYLESLKWDGHERLDRFLPHYTGAADNIYTRAVGKNTILAAVARVYDPGVKHDHMLVLEGKQGIGKSTLVSVLGGKWYQDFPLDPHNKDTVAYMQGCWFIEPSEMDFTRRADVQAMKAFLSRTTDKVRLAYARQTSILPRQSVFIGTINPEMNGKYLTDVTGNRRFWPVHVFKIRLEQLKEDRDQIFAEALVRYKNGEKFYLSDKAIEAAAIKEQRKRLEQDVWLDVIEDWLERNDEHLPDVMTSEYIAYSALNLPAGRINNSESRRLRIVMDSLNWKYGGYYDNQQKKNVRGWKKKDWLEGL